MNRRERIITYLSQHPSSTTSDIANAVHIDRANVSRLLNQCVREGQVQKTDTRPVRYQMITTSQSATTVERVQHKHPKEKPYVFDRITGSHGSMKPQIEQAKAAILYPPKGLNCLITGQTGTGKTLFAHTMFQFAQDKGVIDDKQELTVFNCADYANNADLLMAHLFGYVKGAFTGAESTTSGLIQQADGGILFLDEVHRLPPEGQEMIFYFMDHGYYSRLGEVEKKNHANVRIICATTEDPTSHLLATFMRRIPIVIQLPTYHDRPASEQIDLLKKMLQLEASRIDRCFLLEEDVAKALIGSVEYGNVGQLKSNVQLVCARGFLNHMDQEIIPLTLDTLTPDIKEGIVKLAANRSLQRDISRYLEHEMRITPTNDVMQLKQDAYELPYNLYDIIGDKAAALKAEGLDQEAIHQFITTDINVHLRTFYQNTEPTTVEQKLADIVDKDIIDITKEIKQLLDNQHYEVSQNFIYAMSLHISSFIKRIQSGKELHTVSTNLENMVNGYPTEKQLATQIAHFLASHYHMTVPTVEVYYLATLLISLHSKTESEGNIGILVAAHGNSTASSMVQVVSQLLQVDHIKAFDMALDMSPKEALQGIIQQAKTIDHQHGLLLLVDMGSLTTFEHALSEALHCDVKMMDMVTTAMVLEAARKTTIGDVSLHTLYQELQEFKGYSRTLPEPVASQHPRAILAICSTGEGTAQQIKLIINDQLAARHIDDVTILPVSIVDMDETIERLSQQYTIIGAIGVKPPKQDIPFMDLQTLLQTKGEAFLTNITGYRTANSTDAFPNTTRDIIFQYLEDTFTFLNPSKLIDIIMEYVQRIETATKATLSNGEWINIAVHVGGMIERAVQHDKLHADPEQLGTLTQHRYYKEALEATQWLERQLNIQVSSDELFYVLQLWHTEDTQ